MSQCTCTKDKEITCIVHSTPYKTPYDEGYRDGEEMGQKRIAELKKERDRLYQVLESIGLHPDAEPTIREIARSALKAALLREGE